MVMHIQGRLIEEGVTVQFESITILTQNFNVL